MNLINELLKEKEKIDFLFPNSFDQLMNDDYYDYDKFEWFLYYVFKLDGADVKKIGAKGKGDGGADLIVTQRQPDGSQYRIGIQAKYWKNRVGVGPINQLASAAKRLDLTHLYIITTSDLTSDAKQIAENLDITILRAAEVKKFIEDVILRHNKDIEEKGESNIKFLPLKEKVENKKAFKSNDKTKSGNSDMEEELKSLRLKIAKKYNLFPVYIVYNNAEMAELISASPKTISDLKLVKGFKDKKTDVFGEDIIEFFKSKDLKNNVDENIYSLLLEERPKIAKYNKLTEEEVYSDKVAGYIAKMMPKTKEDLGKIFGFRKENIEIFGEYLLRKINK